MVAREEEDVSHEQGTPVARRSTPPPPAQGRARRWWSYLVRAVRYRNGPASGEKISHSCKLRVLLPPLGGLSRGPYYQVMSPICSVTSPIYQDERPSTLLWHTLSRALSPSGTRTLAHTLSRALSLALFRSLSHAR